MVGFVLLIGIVSFDVWPSGEPRPGIEAVELSPAPGESANAGATVLPTEGLLVATSPLETAPPGSQPGAGGPGRPGGEDPVSTTAPAPGGGDLPTPIPGGDEGSSVAAGEQTVQGEPDSPARGNGNQSNRGKGRGGGSGRSGKVKGGGGQGGSGKSPDVGSSNDKSSVKANDKSSAKKGRGGPSESAGYVPSADDKDKGDKGRSGR